MGVGKHQDTSLIVEMPQMIGLGVPIPSNAAIYREVFHAACPTLLATLAERASAQTSQYRTVSAVWKLRRAQLKIEALIAELAVFPLNNKIYVKVDGEIRYIREVKIKESS